jgi:hypothetical protein
MSQLLEIYYTHLDICYVRTQVSFRDDNANETSFNVGAQVALLQTITLSNILKLRPLQVHDSESLAHALKGGNLKRQVEGCNLKLLLYLPVQSARTRTKFTQQRPLFNRAVQQLLLHIPIRLHQLPIYILSIPLLPQLPIYSDSDRVPQVRHTNSQAHFPSPKNTRRVSRADIHGSTRVVALQDSAKLAARALRAIEILLLYQDVVRDCTVGSDLDIKPRHVLLHKVSPFLAAPAVEERIEVSILIGLTACIWPIREVDLDFKRA